MEILSLEWTDLEDFKVAYYRYQSYFRLYVIETKEISYTLHIYSLAAYGEASQILTIITKDMETAIEEANKDMRAIDLLIKDRVELYETYPK